MEKPEPVITPKIENIAEQGTYEIDGFELPTLAKDPKTGSITPASFVDLITQCLAAMDHPKVNEILQKNGISIRDKNGKFFFPRMTSNSK